MSEDRKPLEKRQLESELRSLEMLGDDSDNGRLDRPLRPERRHELHGEVRALKYALNQDDPNNPAGSLTESHLLDADREGRF